MAAALLRGAVRDLLAAQASRSRAVGEVMRRFGKLMSGITFTLAFAPKGEMSAPLVPSSLLGWLASAAFKDVCERRLHVCNALDCGKLFVSARRHARFCSNRCKSRIHKRATRRRRPRS
jgi:predicted RNA-binding Zn ribbon-like protein